MKRILITVGTIFQLSLSPAMACDVCQEQQPRILRNITHGAGPQGTTDFVIITVAAIIVGLTLIYSIKYLLKPGEKSPDHVKNIILDNY